MTVREAIQSIERAISALYDPREATAIARQVVCSRCGYNFSQLVVHYDNECQIDDFQTIITQLSAARPVQYVLGQAQFCDLTFEVAEGVLIPRPETEELVARVAADATEGARILDVGTGSGILSICASKLGAEHCWAYDIDPVAVKVARENAKDGGITNMTVDVSDLLYGVDKTVGKFDFCVANIVADIILRMLPDIKNYLKEGAPLILSGIINIRADEIREAVKQHGFTIIREEQENDWVALLVK